MIKTLLLQNNLVVKKSPVHGYGVFAKSDIAPFEVIEECYLLCTDERISALRNYDFDFHGQSAIMTGFGCIYNHANNPNAKYVFDQHTCVALFTAIRPIRAGEEIFTSYGADWFSRRVLPVKEAPFWYRWRTVMFTIPLKCAVLVTGFYLITHFIA